MADEARNGETEQLAICVCFVSCEGHITEHFLGLWKLERYDAHCMTDVFFADSIEELLQYYKLKLYLCLDRMLKEQVDKFRGRTENNGGHSGIQSILPSIPF